MSESRMRIRVAQATAVLRLLRGTVCPSGSRDIKRKEKERQRAGGGSWAGSPHLNLSVHTPSQTRPLSAPHSGGRALSAFVFEDLMKLHTHRCTCTHICTFVLASALTDIQWFLILTLKGAPAIYCYTRGYPHLYAWVRQTLQLIIHLDLLVDPRWCLSHSMRPLYKTDFLANMYSLKIWFENWKQFPTALWSHKTFYNCLHRLNSTPLDK